MKIFVAYGYNNRDAWIPDTINPLIEAFGSEPVDGRELGGELLPPAIEHSIAECDALIAFCTRREERADHSWTTHQWVLGELTVAVAGNKKVLEVYENGVARNAGITGSDRQELTINESGHVDRVREI